MTKVQLNADGVTAALFTIAGARCQRAAVWRVVFMTLSLSQYNTKHCEIIFLHPVLGPIHIS